MTHEGSTYGVMKGSDNKIGISLGGGFQFGKKGSDRYEILALYHIIFTELKDKYFSVNIGMLL